MSDARAVPFYCPFCGEEDLFPTTTMRHRGDPESLRPHEDSHGAWHCRSCPRVFSLKLVGLVARQ
jgi:transposase-like protein